jgi:hypothetical protein
MSSHSNKSDYSFPFTDDQMSVINKCLIAVIAILSIIYMNSMWLLIMITLLCLASTNPSEESLSQHLKYLVKQGRREAFKDKPLTNMLLGGTVDKTLRSMIQISKYNNYILFSTATVEVVKDKGFEMFGIFNQWFGAE